MKTLVDHLAQYADYHRDPRNIHTHFVGVPMIMFARHCSARWPAASSTFVLIRVLAW